MVQEFYVLKCYSCETFQVQQVKKSKKWNCKMCGEKQSLIKEFGRGSGVDCRRHVQKLNARRGESLDVQTETALSRSDETADYHEDFGDTAPTYISQKIEDPTESRWSKFLPQPSEGQAQEETAEEADVNLGRNLYNGKRNVRKRKRAFGMSNGAGGDVNEEEVYQRASPDEWSAAKRIVKVQNKPYSKSFTPMERSPKCSTATFKSVPTCSRQPAAQKQRVPNPPHPKPHLTGASNRFKRGTPRASCTTATPTSSKWAQFLTMPTTEEEEQEEDDETSWMSRDRSGNIAPFVKPVSRVVPTNQEDVYEAVNAGEPRCGVTSSLGGLGSTEFLQRNVGGTLNKLKTTLSHCGFGKVVHSGEPAHMFAHVEKEPVCDQPLPTKPPGPFLSVGSLFNMGEDFDVDDF